MVQLLFEPFDALIIQLHSPGKTISSIPSTTTQNNYRRLNPLPSSPQRRPLAPLSCVSSNPLSQWHPSRRSPAHDPVPSSPSARPRCCAWTCHHRRPSSEPPSPGPTSAGRRRSVGSEVPHRRSLQMSRFSTKRKIKLFTSVGFVNSTWPGDEPVRTSPLREAASGPRVKR